MSDELELAYDSQIETEAEVIKLISLGKTPSEIQELTHIPPRVQRDIQGRFAQYAQNDMATQARTKEALAYMDTHFTYLIRELQNVAEEATEPRLKKEALREQANVIKMRLEAMQKAGLLNAEGIGDQLIELEEDKRRLAEMLKEVAKEYPQAGRLIAEKLAAMRGEVISHRVDIPEDKPDF